MTSKTNEIIEKCNRMMGGYVPSKAKKIREIIIQGCIAIDKEARAETLKKVEEIIDELEYDSNDRSVVPYHALKQKIGELQ